MKNVHVSLPEIVDWMGDCGVISAEDAVLAFEEIRVRLLPKRYDRVCVDCVRRYRSRIQG